MRLFLAVAMTSGLGWSVLGLFIHALGQLYLRLVYSWYDVIVPLRYIRCQHVTSIYDGVIVQRHESTKA